MVFKAFDSHQTGCLSLRAVHCLRKVLDPDDEWPSKAIQYTALAACLFVS